MTQTPEVLTQNLLGYQEQLQGVQALLKATEPSSPVSFFYALFIILILLLLLSYYDYCLSRADADDFLKQQVHKKDKEKKNQIIKPEHEKKEGGERGNW